MFELDISIYYYQLQRNFDFSLSNVTDCLKSLMLLQKEMFTCISDDIKPIGCTFNSASSICLNIVLFHIA